MHRRAFSKYALSIPVAIAGSQPIMTAAQSATPEPSPSASPAASPMANRELHTEQVAQITGDEPGINKTHIKWSVYGTDLGSSFMYKDEMVLVFGDTFGYDKKGWRSNVIGFSKDTDPSDGITIDRMITDQAGAAKEVLPSKKIDHLEMTVIPTYGIAVGDRMFLHYMSVSHWGEPGHWDLGSAGFAWSDDGGENWTKDEKAVFPGNTNFGQVAMEEHGGHIYIWGIPGGRYGGVQMARCIPEKLLDIPTWEYWDGSAWQDDPKRAAQIIAPNVGELSVRYNSHYKKWLMMYLDDPMGYIYLRTADDITGPWSEPYIAADGATYPALYAPFLYPRFNDGPDIYFNLSMFGPYHVFLLKTRLP